MKFGSSQRINNYENLNFFPGPGHYDSKSAVGQSKTIPKGQRPAPKTAFGQTSNRFEGMRNEIDLGPGYYFGQKEWQSKKMYKENKAQFYPNPRKIITIPSIPSSTHAMGYVEREDGYLIPLNGSSIKDEHDLGPGAYEADDTVVRKKVQGFGWNKITSPRFPAEKTDDEQKNRITLGNYTLPKREIILESETETKKKDPPKKVLTPEEEARRLQAKLEENPGLSPGYYYNEKIVSSFNVQTKPPEFQNFGTTSKRFDSGGKPTPGPGFYNVQSTGATRTPYMKIEPYSKGEMRFKSAILDDLPGPGAYTSSYNSNTETNWTSQTGFPSAFGSGMTRFVAPKSAQSDMPGPGSYNPFKSSKKSKKRKNRPVITSVIHTATPQQGTTPNFSKDFGYAPELDLGGRSKGAVIVKHEDPANKGTSAFQSVGQRFAQDKDKRSLTPGPGSYEWNNQIKLGVKPTHNTLKTTFSLTPRGHESKGEAYKKMLGPGVYDYSVDPVKPKINYAPKINPVVPAYGAMLPK